MGIKTAKRVEEMLKECGLKRTRCRLNILAVLLKSKNPVTEQEIASKLPGPAPNKATIYRCLEKFIEADVVHRAYLKDRTWHYELSDNCTQTQCHPHFTCIQCGMTMCMPKARVQMVRGLGKGFVVYRQQVRLEGLCPNCS
jgi:Fur family ferric uptake transcriptional regulator